MAEVTQKGETSVLQVPISRLSVSKARQKYLKVSSVIRAVQPNIHVSGLQSSYFEKNLNGDKSMHLFVLCDGVGDLGGHIVALSSKHIVEYVKDRVIKVAKRVINKEYFSLLTSAAFSSCADLLESQKISLYSNGCTCLVSLIVGDTLYSAHVGDSRLIVASQYLEGFSVQNLTHDHVLSNEEELNRIGAAVAHYNLTNGGNHKEEYDIPLTRAIGCLEMSHIGMILKPEVKVFKLTQYDDYLFLGSQGLFRLMSEKQCMNLVHEECQKNNLERVADRLKAELRERQRSGTLLEEFSFILMRIALVIHK